MAECKVNCIWFITTVSCERGAFSTETERSRIVNGLGFSENIPVCELCPLETYTDEIGSTTCLPCPKYHSTVSTGASSVSECLRKCVHVQYLRHPILSKHVYTHCDV